MDELKTIQGKENLYKRIQWRYIVVFLALFGLALLFPYSNDDWAWGSTTGLERLDIFFKDYNGRYLGNLLVLALTRNNILKAAVMSATYTSIAYLIQRIVNKNDNNIFYLAVSSILLADKVLLRQTIVNTSGFTNYTFCILLVLIYVNHISNIEEENKKSKWIVNISLLLLGFCTCLFMEHISIYVFLISAFICAYAKIKLHKTSISNIFYFVGTTAGCLCMFTNGAYLNVLKGDDFYRTAPPGFMDKVHKAATNLFDTLSPNTIYNHLFINLLICALTIALCIKGIQSLQKKRIVFSIFAIIVTLVTNMYFVAIQLDNSWSPLMNYTDRFTGVLAVLYFFFVALIVWKLVDDKKAKWRLLFPLLSVAILTLPLLVLSPVTPRCSLPMYIFLMLFMCELYAYIFKDCHTASFKTVTKYVLISVVCFALLYLTSIYSYITAKNQERLKDINSQLENGSKTVCIEKNSYEQYVWKNYPVSRTWEIRFLDFYGYDTKLDVEVINKDNPAYDAYTAKIPKDIKNLMIVAHPDDELIWGGEHLIKDKYLVVCITNGHDDIRSEEFKKVMKATGDSYIMLDFPDKVYGQKSEWLDCGDSISNALAEIIDAKDWDVIVTHNPQGEYGHIQHKKTSRIVTNLVDNKSKLVYFGKYYSAKQIDAEVKAGIDDPYLKQMTEENANKKLEIFSTSYISQNKTHFYHMFKYENFITYKDWVNMK